MSIKPIASYTDSIEANIALSKLQANDIPCFLTNELTNDMLWHMSQAMGGIKLMVHEDNFDKAQEVLLEQPLEVLEDDNSNIQCPNCGSTNVKFGTQTKLKYDWLGLLVSIIIFSPAPISNKGYHCFKCGEDFTL